MADYDKLASKYGGRLGDGADEYDLIAKRLNTRPEPRQNPTDGMGTGERLLAGVGKAFVDTGRGVGQLFGMVSDDDVAYARQNDAALMNTAAGKVGNFGGNVAVALPTLAIPGAATVRGAAMIGAGQGALQPSVSRQETLNNMMIGGAAGGAGILGGRVLMGGAAGAKAMVEPFTRAGRSQIAGRMIQRFADDPAAIAAAQGGRSITGAQPTLAELTGDRGMAQLQDALRSVDPQIANRIAQRLSDNNAARVGSLQSLAGDSSKREAAEAARKAASSGLYQQATGATYAIDGELADLLSRPAVKAAVSRAKSLAENQGRSFSFNPTPESELRTITNTWAAPKSVARQYGAGPSSAAVKPSAGSVTRTIDVRAVTAGEGVARRAPPQISGQGLQDLKMALDEMLTDPASGFTGAAGNTIKDLRGKLVGWMEGANPDFKAARETYSKASKPINGMDVGEEIARRASSATSDLAGNPRMQADALLRMLKDEQALLRKATGRKELSSLDQVFEPDQLRLLNTVSKEADRAAAVAREGAGPGSATAQRMASQNILRQLIGPTGLPQSWAESALANTVIGKPFNLVYGGVAEPKIQQLLADAMLDPNVARSVMQATQSNGPRIPHNALMELLTNSARLTPSTLAVTGER